MRRKSIPSIGYLDRRPLGRPFYRRSQFAHAHAYFFRLGKFAVEGLVNAQSDVLDQAGPLGHFLADDPGDLYVVDGAGAELVRTG